MKLTWTQAKIESNTPRPTHGRYSTVAKFADIAKTWPRETWSVVLEIVETERSSESWQASGTLRFLMEEAPHELLYSGSRFELYEGSVCVAMGCALWTDATFCQERAGATSRSFLRRSTPDCRRLLVAYQGR